MRQELISQIEMLAAAERFKQDAFFFCGSSTDTPNEALLEACENYLKEVSGSAHACSAVTDKLVSALESVLLLKQRRPKAMCIETSEDMNTVMIRHILENKEQL